MTASHKSFVRETLTNKPNAATSFALNVAAIGADGFRNVDSAYTGGDIVPYSVSDGAGLWEQGEGAFDATAKTVARTTIHSSSNSDAAVDFSAAVGNVVLQVEWSAESANESNNQINLGFSVYGSTGSNILLPPATFVPVINWQIANHNEGNHFDLLTGTFTVPKTGLWEIGAAISFFNIATATVLITRLYINVTDHVDLHLTGNARSSNISYGSTEISLIQGDSLVLKGYGAGAATNSFFGTATVGNPKDHRFSAKFIR